ncbi:MAG: hypothetical protein COY47_03135, partial [Chloroflexi bacterium CG_4_10_14_0_8_um_filter_57_5]
MCLTNAPGGVPAAEDGGWSDVLIQTITAIKPQKKNPRRVNVYLDGEFAFGLSKLIAAWLKVGQTLPEEKIASLQAEDERETVYQKALH